MPKPKLDDQITFRLTKPDKQELIRHAERLDRTPNWLARDILVKWLEKHRRRARPKG